MSVKNQTLGLPGGRAGLALLADPADAAGGRAACFHCGEPCPEVAIRAGDKVFCCQGCRVVHDLLAENGLREFYELSRHPGVRIGQAVERGRWSFLDEPAVQERLLDFTDGKISRVTFEVPAIHCVACVWLLENLFRLHPGVGQVQVNFPRREVSVQFAPEQLSLGGLAALLASIGYEPRLTLGELERQPSDPAERRRWVQLGVAGFAFGNIMLLSIPLYLGLDQPVFRGLFGWLSLALAAPVLAYSAGDYWRSAWYSVRQRALTVDVPIALGLVALYGQSAWEIIAGRGGGYLDSLVGLVFLLLCGRAFQRKTQERMAFDRDYKCFFPLCVNRLVDGQRQGAEHGVDAASPSECRQVSDVTEAFKASMMKRPERRTPEESSASDRPATESVSISSLRVGDRLLVRHGELIPADSRLLSGTGRIDYSFVTGEAEPVARRPGDYVYAGGKQAGAAIAIETLKPVSQSYLASLWDHEAFRQPRGSRLETLTNRYSRLFTAVVLGLAAGAFVFWLWNGEAGRGLKAFTSVLIVACPCALALAAPFTLGTAQRLLARRRVFLKNTQVLERLARVEAVVFDKTGTLTAAGVSGVRLESDRPLDEQESVLAWSLASHSTHPHAVRIAGALAGEESPLPVEDFSEFGGKGIEGRVAGHRVQLGSAVWLAAQGVAVASARAGGGSDSVLAIDGQYRGRFEIPNALRPATAEFVQQLGADCELALLSGDHAAEAAQFRQLFGPEARLRFNQSPLDKLSFIRRLQEEGKTVMMVGDGLNDAGALKQSDVGVAVVENTAAFSPASDVILEGGQVPALPRIFRLARRSTRIVIVSFAISAAYNVAGIGVAAAGLLSPLLCAVLMPLSSVSVVLFACGATTWAARKEGLV